MPDEKDGGADGDANGDEVGAVEKVVKEEELGVVAEEELEYHDASDKHKGEMVNQCLRLRQGPLKSR
ncbi:hypothetical protein GIB67_021761 [Kingdonia uniflora]|uniref:Uncharacterized protein n=1 Tax=Kingdonia uniflora TaxID=39325 RepID=A0A7J7M9L9_9MAGN|nr:hypothetical protein GIB67_021761 [Kingdonia uniflora]